MRKVFSGHPFLSSAGLFVGALLGALTVAYLMGIWILSTANCPSKPNDPCDAAPMLVMSLWMLAIPASLVLAAALTAINYYLYWKK